MMADNTRPDMRMGEVELIRLDLDEGGPVSLGAARALLSAEEAARAARFAFDAHRNRFIRARGALRRMLGERLGENPAKLRIEIGAHGKPFVRGGEVHFNISHSRNVAVFVFALFPDIGADVELVDRKIDFDAVGARVFTPAERAVMAEMTESVRQRMFFHLWTAKEARMKATGEGFRLHPQRIEIAFVNGAPRAYRLPRDPVAHLAMIDGLGEAEICAVAALRPLRLRIGSFGEI